MSLLSHVRNLTGVDSTLVPDAVVTDALTKHRRWNDTRVVWLTDAVGEAPVWGMLDTATAIVVDSADAEVDLVAAGATLDAYGGVTLDADGDRPTWLVNAYGVDVNKVASVVCRAAAVALARDFDFATDGQSFKRSQQREAFEAAADRFARSAMPTTVSMARSDDDAAANPRRTSVRRRGY